MTTVVSGTGGSAVSDAYRSTLESDVDAKTVAGLIFSTINALIVPVEVIGPPVRPVPVAIDVTPDPEANAVQAPLYPSNKPVVEL